ncbi:MAG: flagellar FliJ family protein [Alphaproteobacteria bacterium]|nr:flagellar FliJ family protein [Alphaproteobacteria bacterium]
MAVKSLETLIKLQKTFVDEQRIHLARLQDNLEAIDNRIVELEIRKARELEAARDEAARATYGAFLGAMVEQGRALEKDRQTAALAVKIAQEKLAELFEEQKRYEIAEEQRLATEAKKERRRETIDLDEIGGVMHERNK